MVMQSTTTSEGTPASPEALTALQGLMPAQSCSTKLCHGDEICTMPQSTSPALKPSLVEWVTLVAGFQGCLDISLAQAANVEAQ